MTGYEQACKNLEQMTAAYQSMTKNMTQMMKSLSMYAGVNLRLGLGLLRQHPDDHLALRASRRASEHSSPRVWRYFPFLMVNNGTVVLSEGGFVPMQGTMTAAPGVGMPMGGAVGGSGSGMMGNAGTQPGQPLVPVPMHQSGFGDIVGSVGYRVVDDRLKGLQVVLSTRLKFPTASASNGLGTGRMDVGVVGTLRTQFDHGWFYGEGGYVVIGNPAGADLRNAVLRSAAAGRQIHTRTDLLASAFGNSAVVPQFTPTARQLPTWRAGPEEDSAGQPDSVHSANR